MRMKASDKHHPPLFDSVMSHLMLPDVPDSVTVTGKSHKSASRKNHAEHNYKHAKEAVMNVPPADYDPNIPFGPSGVIPIQIVVDEKCQSGSY